MKIKMLVGLAGPDSDAKPGDVIELPDAEARRYIASEAAVAVQDTVKGEPKKVTR